MTFKQITFDFLKDIFCVDNPASCTVMFAMWAEFEGCVSEHVLTSGVRASIAPLGKVMTRDMEKTAILTKTLV